jgi:hypothetical protein
MNRLRVAQDALLIAASAFLATAVLQPLPVAAQTGDSAPQELPLVNELTLEAPVLDESVVTEALTDIHPFYTSIAWQEISGQGQSVPTGIPSGYAPLGAEVEAEFVLEGVAFAMAARDTRITAAALAMLDGHVLLRNVHLVNRAGEARIDALLLSHDAMAHLGDFFTGEVDDRILPEQAGLVAAGGVTLTTQRIEREDRPGPRFFAQMSLDALRLDGLRASFPEDASKRLFADALTGGEARGSAQFAGEAEFSLSGFTAAIDGPVDELSPRKLLSYLEKTPEQITEADIAPVSLDLGFNDFAMQVTGRRGNPDMRPVVLAIADGGLRLALDDAGILRLAGRISNAQSTPQILAGTPLEEVAMRTASVASAGGDRLHGAMQADATLAPGYAIAGDLWLDVPGLATLRAVTDVDLPDNLRESLRGGRMAALLPLIFESTARRMTFALIDDGIGPMIETETGSSLREWVGKAVSGEAPAGGAGGMEAMTLQIALGQLDSVFAILEDEGSVMLETRSERPASLVLAAIEFLRSAKPVPDKNEIRPE